MKKTLKKELPSHVFPIFSVLSVLLLAYLFNAVNIPIAFSDDASNSLNTEVLSESGINEMPFLDMPGTIEATGTHFEITDSEYLNITLESSEQIELRLESIPEMITMTFEPVNTATQTQITLSGLEASTTYYKYEDNYHNLTEFTTDITGSHTYTQDITSNHFVFIQPRASTKFIADNATGGDCTSIGIWDNSTKTCTLTTDLNESIQIDSDGITLDGNGHSLTGTSTGFGVLASGVNNVIVENLIIDFFSTGIVFSNSLNSLIVTNTILGNNTAGISIGSSSGTTVESNNIFSAIFGLGATDSSSLTITNNVLDSGMFGFLGAMELSRVNNSMISDNSIEPDRSGGGSGIRLSASDNNLIARNDVLGRFTVQVLLTGSRNELINNDIGGSSTGIWIRFSSDNNQIYNNNFLFTNDPILDESDGVNIFNLDKPVGGNHYGLYSIPLQGCNDIDSDGFCDDPFVFTGGQDNLPWVEQDGWVAEEPAVLFLPGVLGSRLDIGSNRLWEPNTETDVEKLYLNEQGKSINNVEVDGALDEFLGLSGLKNIYKSFLNDLEDKKTQGAISDYSVATYDWRLSIPDILNEGDIEQKLRDLASGSGKVTIVAHSNGGLVAKALINQLGTEAEDLIDNVVFVAVPQIGTPKTVGTLFHGYDVGIPHNSFPFILDPARARDFANNAPFAYHLLPHSDYYSNAGTEIQTKIASFQDGEATQQFIDKYGTEIDTTSELYQLIKGEEGRDGPAFEDINELKIGNEFLLDQALGYIQGIGSNWQPPAGIDVHQIAGIGEDTLAGMDYESIRECTKTIVAGFSVYCARYEDKISYTPNEVIDGDNTVVAPSALVMSDTVSNVNRWWLNLQDHNGFFPVRVDRKHADILEVDELRLFIFNNFITEITPIPPRFISETKPSISKGKRLRFVLHSPLELSVIDKDGNELGEIVSDIPGGRYTRYGEVQVIIVPADSFPTLNLEGTEEGTFTLGIEQYDNETLVATTTFSGIVSSADTIATMDFSDGTIENAGDLQMDFNGDSTVDLNIVPEVGEEVPMPEPTISQLIEVLSQQIQALSLQGPVKKQLFNITSTIERQFNNQESLRVQLTEQIENLQNNPNSQKAIDVLQKKIDDLEQKRTEAKSALTDAVIIFQEHTDKQEISSKELISLTRTLLRILHVLR